MNKSEIKAIFVDIDFTLYDHYKNEFNKEEIDALNKAQANGVKIILATARPYDTMQELGTLDVLKPDGYFVNNGAIAVFNKQILYEHYFPNEVIKHIVKVMKKRKTTCEIATFDKRYMLAPCNKAALNVFHAFKNSIPPTIEYSGQKVCTAMLFGKPWGDKKLQEQLGKDITIYRFCPDAMDLTYEKPHLKGETLMLMINKIGIDPQNVMAIGDDIADVSMFEKVKYSIAMGNANDEVKNHAKYIAKHISDGGFAELFKKLEII